MPLYTTMHRVLFLREHLLRANLLFCTFLRITACKKVWEQGCVKLLQCYNSDKLFWVKLFCAPNNFSSPPIYSLFYKMFLGKSARHFLKICVIRFLKKYQTFGIMLKMVDCEQSKVYYIERAGKIANRVNKNVWNLMFVPILFNFAFDLWKRFLFWISTFTF